MALLTSQWLDYFNEREPVGMNDTVVFDIDDTVRSRPSKG